MNLRISIPAEEYKRLKERSNMLGRIAGVVSRYAAQDHSKTTLECVVALNDRVRNLDRKVRNHKNAGGKFLD